MSNDVDELLNIGDRGRRSDSGDFWAFRSFLTPVLIQVFFWLGVLACAVLGGMMIEEASSTYRATGPGTLMGVCMILFGPVIIRVQCECLIVFFRINSTLTEIKDKLEHTKTPGGPPPLKDKFG